MNVLKILWNLFVDLLFPEPYEITRALALETSSVIAALPKVSFSHEHVRALLSYEHPLVRDIVWLLKYKGDKRAAKFFAEAFREHFLEELSDMSTFSSQIPLLVPIPLSSKRRRERGFNQNELIAEELMTFDPPLEYSKTILVKHRHTKPQSELPNKAKRLTNLKDCFSITARADIKNKTIILIDDVTTTGTTLNEARKVLLRAGAKNVICVAVAH